MWPRRFTWAFVNFTLHRLALTSIDIRAWGGSNLGETYPDIAIHNQQPPLLSVLTVAEINTLQPRTYTLPASQPASQPLLWASQPVGSHVVWLVKLSSKGDSITLSKLVKYFPNTWCRNCTFFVKPSGFSLTVRLLVFLFGCVTLNYYYRYWK